MLKSQAAQNITETSSAIHVDLWYPRSNDVKHIHVGLVDTRSADEMRISYDFERDGYRIESPTIHEWEADDQVMDKGWVEVAFVPAQHDG